MTAEIDHSISTATQKQTSASRPTSPVPTAELDASAQVPRLLEAIEAEANFVQDRFQAQICTGWLYWVVGEYNLALVRLPESLDPEHTQIDNFGSASDWTKVCALKASYLRANCHVRLNRRIDALATFETAVLPLSTALSGQQNGKQLRYWSELFLTEFCINITQALEDNEKRLDDPNCLSAFRAWAKYWENGNGPPVQGGYGFSGSVPRRRVWYDYYSALSSILQEDLPFPTGNMPVTGDSSAKSSLRIELKKVEAAYEALLLGETQFPMAEEEREEVESFVRIVMQNWAIITGRSWREQDLGLGGRESLSRGVLDILYRAATKTYHSTAILRYLFTVHLSVGEFDLAFEAFGSYFELAKKGKARVEKTGRVEPSLDSDAQVLETISSCVIALCRYGDRAAAEKARDLGQELEHWIEKLKIKSHRQVTVAQDNGENPELDQKLPPGVLAFAWQAIGLSQARWSRTTFDATSRNDIQEKAVLSLKRSLSPEYGSSADTRSLFALGLLLAERRELTGAIEVVKAALMMDKPPPEDRGSFAECYLHERLLMPLWHLLALLLSARQDYVMAVRACEGAMQQFKDPVVLFGTPDLKNHYRSEHLNEAEAQREKIYPPGLVDEMDDYEKECMLEVKMTQLALVELMEGPDVAVNASYELLSLFSRLFGKVETPPNMRPPKSTLPILPKSSTGTLRTIRGTIFGQRSDKRGRKPSVRGISTNSEMIDLTDRPMTTQTAASTMTMVTAAPSIQITSENGLTTESVQRRPSHGKRSQSARRGNSLRKRDQNSRKRAVSTSGGSRRPTLTDSDVHFAPTEDSDNQAYDFFTFSSKRQASGASATPPVRSLSHLSSRATSTGGVSDVSTVATQLPTVLGPIVQFSKEHEKRNRTAILVKVWLMIAGFYRRAHMLDDCRGAIGEAQKYTQMLEKQVCEDSTGEVSVRNAGWAGNRSVNELHGDCWAEVSLCFCMRRPSSAQPGKGKKKKKKSDRVLTNCFQLGNLAVVRKQPYAARTDFEAALTQCPDHPEALVGLSNILMDMYSEKLLPPPAVHPLNLPGTSVSSVATGVSSEKLENPVTCLYREYSTLPSGPLGLSGGSTSDGTKTSGPSSGHDAGNNIREMLNRHMKNTGTFGTIPSAPRGAVGPGGAPAGASDVNPLPPAYKAKSMPLVDRLAARDRAYGLLSGLTRLGTGWNNAEAWFALARAHEESGQLEKAKEVLWWCVELEEGSGVRPWGVVSGSGGYML